MNHVATLHEMAFLDNTINIDMIKKYATLYARYKGQAPNEIFSHFFGIIKRERLGKPLLNV